MFSDGAVYFHTFCFILNGSESFELIQCYTNSCTNNVLFPQRFYKTDNTLILQVRVIVCDYTKSGILLWRFKYFYVYFILFMVNNVVGQFC